MTSPQTDLLRVVYFSRNKIAKPNDQMTWEIDNILELSQSNNARSAVTGALIFNDGVFGQVLEGPRDAVEETFERIQMDDRHYEVTLLDIAPISERSFADWSMGFVGKRDLRESFHGRTTVTDFDISLLSGEDIYGLLCGLALKNEVSARAA